MTRPTGALVLRPEPGNGTTLARLRAAGVDATGLPLFAVAPVGWTVPDLAPYDSLLFTSAQALRHGGEGLASLRCLPAIAVGEATAAAARDAGFAVAAAGRDDVMDALAIARTAGLTRPLHLAGRDHRAVAPTVIVYDSVAVDPAPGALQDAAGRVVLLHSARAAAHFAALVDRDGVPRPTVGIAALGPAVLAAAGEGWGRGAAAPVPTDAALVALACDFLASD